ncbi:MFS transporter [Rhodococcus fascians]|nr:MFS transporter [Rhodococcus fascians]MBY4140522.1 MFS transporter [Rhodococcus fascians]MBY4219010.1 MFS transporter [Rhodococcus fascians]MBY4221962.1 MFS transporter [Rhodococcus fascians]MBY4233963.1 MFS transporter [Rhodococcus fascians]
MSKPLMPPPQSEGPSGLATVAETGSEQIGAALRDSEPAKLRFRQLGPLFLAQATLYVAFIAPSAFSLAIRLEQIAPEGKNTLLAIAVGLPALFAVLIGPVAGVLSDRTRSRMGRRRPWLLGGGAMGLIGTTGIGLASTPALIIAGWTVAFVGYTIVSIMILAYLADRLPESQRGRVAGINGAITQIAPIAGVSVAGSFVHAPVLMFAIPAAIAFFGGLVFVVLMKDPANPEARATLRTDELLQGFWFNPRKYPNLGWVWLSKALVFTALSFLQLYNVYLISSKLGLEATAVAALVASVGLLNVVAAIAGAIGSGYLSDKFSSRRPFLVVSATTLGVGLVTVGSISSVPQYVIGSLICSLSIGVYGSVDQALQLDVLPPEENQNGRYLSTLNLANQSTQAVGPFMAAGVLLLAGGDYSWVYYVAALFTVLGAVAIIPVKTSKHSETGPVTTQ